MSNILELAESGSADNVLRDMRVRSLWTPYYFGKVVLGYRKLVDHLHQHDMELFVTRWSQGCLKQFIEWPRAFYKTTSFTITCGIWGVLPVTDEDTEYALNILHIPDHQWWARVALHDQDATQLLAFETIDNAKRKIGQIRWHFEENQLFRTLFPEIACSGKEPTWNSECLTIRRVGDRRRDLEGTFEAAGVGVAIQSRHYTRCWEDDLTGEKARKSAGVMEDTIGWHGRLAGVFESAVQQTRFGVSNRWGYADLNSHVRANEPDFIFYTRSAWEIDPETGENVSIFPEEYSMDDLLRIRDAGSMTRYDFSCQYLNSPTMPGEKEVDDSLLHYYKVEQDGRMLCSCGGVYYASALNRYLHYDPYNAKGAGSKSCPALAMIGCSSDEHTFLLDSFTVKENYGKIYDKIFHMNDVWRPIAFTYEDVGHQNMTKYHIETVTRTQEYKSKHKNFPRIVPIPTGNRSKEIRIRESLFPVIEHKKFAIRATQTVFTTQLETFPNTVLTHDYDLLDAISQGNSKDFKWRYPDAEVRQTSQKAEEDEYLRHFNSPYSHAGA